MLCVTYHTKIPKTITNLQYLYTIFCAIIRSEFVVPCILPFLTTREAALYIILVVSVYLSNWQSKYDRSVQHTVHDYIDIDFQGRECDPSE